MLEGDKIPIQSKIYFRPMVYAQLLLVTVSFLEMYVECSYQS